MAKRKKRRSTPRRKPTYAPKPRDRPSRREQIAQARRQKQRRRYLTTALVVVAVIAAVGLLIWLNSRPLPLVTAEADVPADAQGAGWGPPGAPVVVEDWSDFGWPACEQLSTGAGRQIQEIYSGTGQVRFEYKNFAFIGETSTLAAEAVLCAADQGQFWPYHDTVFANQDTLFESGTDYRRALKQMAKMLELDTRAFNRCFNGRVHRQDVQQELADGRARGVESTPTVFVNDVNLGYPRTFEEIQRVIEEELAKASQ